MGSSDAPVHAFPNANLRLPDQLPVQLSDLSALTIDVQWTYGSGNAVADSLDDAALEEAGMNANVCVDMFLSSDKDKAANTTESDFEVMVWLGRWGDATDPIGYAKGPQDNYTVNGTVL